MACDCGFGCNNVGYLSSSIKKNLMEEELCSRCFHESQTSGKTMKTFWNLTRFRQHPSCLFSAFVIMHTSGDELKKSILDVLKYGFRENKATDYLIHLVKIIGTRYYGELLYRNTSIIHQIIKAFFEGVVVNEDTSFYGLFAYIIYCPTTISFMDRKNALQEIDQFWRVVIQNTYGPNSLILKLLQNYKLLHGSTYYVEYCQNNFNVLRLGPMFNESDTLIGENYFTEDNKVQPLRIRHTLTVKRYPQLSKDVICSICLGEADKNNGAIMLAGCKHVFHKACLQLWCSINCSCPLCHGAV